MAAVARFWPVGLVVVTAAGLVGCAGDDGNPLGLPTVTALSDQSGADRSGAQAPNGPVGVAGASGATLVAPGATGTDSAVARLGYAPADPGLQGAWVQLGTVRVRSSQQRAVVSAFVAFERVRLQAFNTQQADPTTLAAVASGAAVADTVANAKARADQDLFTVGRYLVNVSDVTITGDQATVAGCALDGTSEVAADGQTTDFPPGPVSWVPTLQRFSGNWKVVKVPKDGETCVLS